MKKVIIWSLCAVVLAGCATASLTEPPAEEEQPLPEPEVSTTSNTEVPPSPTSEPTEPRMVLDDFGLAPEFTNEVWLNTEGPLRLEDLRGSVVLLDMWTFG